MKKAKRKHTDELRPEYSLADFRRPMVRGKYAARMKQSSNVVVLSPEVANVFPNEDAVNKALLSLIKIARTSANARGVGSRGKRRAA